MLLTTTTEFLYKKYGIDKTIEMIAEAGFDAIDYSAFEMLKDEDPINQPDYKEYALRVRKKAESCGVRFVQAHAPFPSSRDDEVYNTSIKEKIIRCMEACAIMGVEIIVVHPIQHLSYMNNVETLFDMNMEFYKDLVTYAEKFNIRVATENMFQYDANRDVMRDSTCASPEEFCRYIDTVNSPYLTGCLDIGHCGLCGREPYDMIEYIPYRKRVGT